MAPLGQEREPSGVIEVAVGHQDRIQFLFRGGRRTVEGLGFPSTLKQAAVNQDTGLLGLYVVGRTGDFAPGGADNGDSHSCCFSVLIGCRVKLAE